MPPSARSANPAEAWAAAARAAAESRVTMIVGDADTGKTTLTAALANELIGRGFRVAVVDADVGQSEIGPPTTVGLGAIQSPVGRLGDAAIVALYFVGSTSPGRAFTATVHGAATLVQRALADGYERVLVDTAGLVRGDFGQRFTIATIGRVRPDAVVCLEHAAECDAIVSRYRAAPAPTLVRLPSLNPGRRRTQVERRQHRTAALQRYFSTARRTVLERRRVAVREVGSDRELLPPPSGPALNDALVGLENAAGETLGLGTVVQHDSATLTIDTPVSGDAIAALRAGRERHR